MAERSRNPSGRIEPDLFLHRVDIAAGRAIFVRTDAESLRAAAFLDGRTTYWTGAPVEMPLAALAAPADTGVDRYIFHVGFCGSTLLARLLDRPGRMLALREPQSLTDLATWRAALDRAGARDQRLAPLTAAVRASLRRRWRADEAILVKPSSWVNGLLPDLAPDPAGAGLRPLFLTMDRRAFVRAVLRGGSARVAFAARAAVHLSNAGRSDAERVAQALARPADDRLTTLAALLHGFQLDRFQAAARGWGAAHWLTADELRADPAAAAAKAAIALDLDPGPLAPARLAGHAKRPEIAFSAAAEAAADAAVEAEHGARIDRTLAWIDETAAR